MYLKSLEIQGFKSFPDKTELKFNKGITAVVGPNGSGKSNISDAMRWVMGEQSTKAMRDEKMSGVIFHGTQTRPKSQFAQVTINISNDDRTLNYDSDLVSVSRKLYQNGDSEYMINGNSVRLKDVVELFMDTGLGRDGYSIIGQGRIADIVKGRSSDRREIFEEAAGIAKLRFKKEEAQKKLVSAQDNIDRLNDIITELQSRIGPLKAQSEKAKKFRVLDDEKRELEVSVWNHKLNSYMRQIQDFEEKLASLKQQYDALSEELSDADSAILENAQKSAQKLEEIENLRESIHLIEEKNSQSKTEMAVIENDISHLEEKILQLNEQIEQAKSFRYFNKTELEKRQKDLEKLNSEKEKSDKQILDKEAQIQNLLLKTEDSDKSISEVNASINKVYLKKNELNFKLESAKKNISDFNEQLESAVESQKEIENNNRLASKELGELRTAKRNADEKKQECENKLAGLNKLYESKQSKLDESREELSKSQLKLRELDSKLSILKDLENSMEGFTFSVKHVLTAGKQGRIKGVCGSVAQLIDVKTEHTVAIETALGATLQNIVVTDESVAKRCISLLKEDKAGRATFLPITSVKARIFENKGLDDCEGYVSMASELVKTDEKYSQIIGSLLGNVCVSEDIDSASVIAKKYGYKFKIVTLDGQVVNAGGSYTGGSVSKSTGILSRKNEIEQISGKKEQLLISLKNLDKQVDAMVQETSKYAADIDGLKEELGLLSNDCVRFESEIKRVKDFVVQYEKQLDDIDLMVEQLKGKLVSSQKEIESVTDELSQTDKEIIEWEAKLTVSQSQQEELKKKRETLSDELSEMRVTSTEHAKDIESCKLAIEQLKSVLESNTDENSKLDFMVIECRNDIKNNKQKISDAQKALDDSVGEIEKLNSDIALCHKQHLEFDAAANGLRNKFKNKMDEKENLSTQITRTEERTQTVKENFDKLVAQLWDDYELTRSDAAEMAIELDNLDDANKHLTELRNKIKNLGSVNLGAIEEYAEVSERYEFMTGQLKDVNESKQELETMIEQLTENMKSMFIQTFDVINNNFKKIFSEMFGGGKAELILTDPEDVLECGIDINAQPPGKVITNLLSLSGGEQSLVAISIYFAILKHSPSPFCLLDEIEAALDDSNVTRYAQYLHRLTDKTQFIAITHRRGTMEEADMLYGVTMQDKGISRLLSMSSSDVQQMKLE